ncbi:ABC transporter substrate-binding protein [Streptomyces sp. NPDC051976]|uniref:substrate-binding periplasmic protein n=1 Tax=Streptomyces sp. NPDC051976 TaxID=3154947 RepID=UPI0034457F88
MAPRGVARRTVASVLGIRHSGGAAPVGPRPRGGHSLARRCVAAVLGVPLPPAARPAARQPLQVVHGWTAPVPPDHELDLLGPPQALAAPPRPRLHAWPALLLAATCAAAALAIVMTGVRPFRGSHHVAPATQGALFHLLPSRIQHAGKIIVGTTDQAPMVSLSGGAPTGLDPDLLRALGRELGVEVDFASTDRGSLVQEVMNGRVDVAAAGLTVTAARGRYVDFVEYLTAGSVVTVPAANPGHIDSIADLCGKRVAVVTGTTAAASLTAGDCAGAPVQTVADSSPVEALESVRIGVADASFTDFPSADYVARQPNSRLAIVGRQIDPAPYGFAVGKQDAQLRRALKAALDAVIDDGTYRQIVAKYHLTSGAVSAARVDGGA